MSWRPDPFYLITGDVAALEQLVPLGVRLVQLRIKNRPVDELRRQIARARDLCARHGAQLV
ncbi:MAG: thiamine phosphate synthase, partial [Paracoccus sp. (in: a-proteobacteria)]|nr:thiamine phosphate synthase [Paracoccus sp. (in: a-proteobacteria)]